MVLSTSKFTFPLSHSALCEECHHVQTAPEEGRHLHCLFVILLYGKHVHSPMVVCSFVCLSQYGSVQLSSVVSRVQLFATPWTAAQRPPCPSPTPGACSDSCPSNHLILCHPLLLLPSIFPSIRVFSNESVLPFRWPKYWSFSFSISPSNAYSGLISFRMDWLALLAVQRTLKSLLQHYSSKASVLQCSAFFMV